MPIDTSAVLKVISASSVIAAGGTVVGVQNYADDRYAPAGEYVTMSDFKQSQYIQLKGQWFDRLDDYREAIGNNNTTRIADIKEELESLLAEICELKPTFKACSEGIPSHET